jgi:hypothetical protein
VTKRNYCMSHDMLLILKREAERLLRIGYIEPSTSEWLNPVRPVTKGDGSIRLCLDLRLLNELVGEDNYSMPRIPEILETLRG